jgi:hypothetical protein
VCRKADLMQRKKGLLRKKRADLHAVRQTGRWRCCYGCVVVVVVVVVIILVVVVVVSRGRGRRSRSLQSRWYCRKLAEGVVLSSVAEGCRSPKEGVAALWLEARVAAPVQGSRKTKLKRRHSTALQSGPDLLALVGEGTAADLLHSLSASSRLPDLFADRRQSRAVERRGDIRVGLAEDAPSGELHELSTQDVERAGGQADGGATAVVQPGDEVASLDLEEVVQVHVALVLHLLPVLELQERLVGAGGRPALPHRQVLAVVFPDVLAAVLALDAAVAERCHLEASGDLLAILTHVDVPDHGGVATHLVVDVGLLLKQQGGIVPSELNLRLKNETRGDVRAAEVLVKFRGDIVRELMHLPSWW